MEKQKIKGRRREQASDVYLDYACSLTLRRVQQKEQARGRAESKGRRTD